MKKKMMKSIIRKNRVRMKKEDPRERSEKRRRLRNRRQMQPQSLAMTSGGAWKAY